MGSLFLGIGIGLVCGACFGVLIAGMCAAAARADSVRPSVQPARRTIAIHPYLRLVK